MNNQQALKEIIPPLKILIVDDRIENLIALEKTLADLDAKIVKAESGDEALSLLIDQDFALILLDVQMPDIDGFETAELIRSNKDSEHIPIIFVTAISKDQKHIFNGYDSGAVDYLFKPLDPHILISKVKIFLDLATHKAMVEQANHLLKKANRKIFNQQSGLIKKARLYTLLQMAGATAHELNQPLMSLLGNIDLLRMKEDDPDERKRLLDSIESAGQRISEIVNKIQNIHRDQIKPYAGGQSIIDINQP